MRYNLDWGSLRLINREGVYEKRKLYQTRLYKYNITYYKISNIPYNLIFTNSLIIVLQRLCYDLVNVISL
jgi:hypothetical protein